MRIRREAPADSAAIAELTEAAFGQPDEARLVEAIRGSDGFLPELSLVEEEQGQVVAHAMLSYAALAGSGARVLLLAPVSVLPAYQRRGIGSALVRELLERADARGEPLVLVVGHPGFYPRFGFRPASTLGFLPPDPAIPDEAFMAAPLHAYRPALRGLVILPPAFAETG